MAGGREWTTGERRRMFQLRNQRFSTRQIARLLNRTEDAIASQLKYVPGGGKKPTERRNWRPKASPSERLRVATLIAIIHFANDNGLDINSAAQRLLYAKQS